MPSTDPPERPEPRMTEATRPRPGVKKAAKKQPGKLLPAKKAARAGKTVAKKAAKKQPARKLAAKKQPAKKLAKKLAAKKLATARPPAPPRTPPGSRPVSMFFDSYPRFYETSRTAPSSDRLNMRYEAIFGENAELFEGARVLDIASHDGRWSLAALATGAASVIGIEAREELTSHAAATLDGYGFGPDRATFVTGDLFDVLATRTFDVDVVLCLGFLYHTLRYNELMKGIRDANPRHIIIDTQAHNMMGKFAEVQLTLEGDWQGNAVVDDFSYGNRMLTGRPNLRAIARMMKAYGFEVESLSDWAAIIRDNPHLAKVGDYAAERRVTVRCRDATG